MCPSLQRYQDSNLEMLESESSALPFGDSAILHCSKEIRTVNVGKRIRTPDLLVRSQTLYPAELNAQVNVEYSTRTINFCQQIKVFFAAAALSSSANFSSAAGICAVHDCLSLLLISIIGAPLFSI